MLNGSFDYVNSYACDDFIVNDTNDTKLDRMRGVLTKLQCTNGTNDISRSTLDGGNSSEVTVKIASDESSWGYWQLCVRKFQVGQPLVSATQFSQSQNDNPESELPLLAGDYVLVWGEIDEDGYLEAELMDGRRGLVPSNYITKLVGEDLMEFHQSMVVGTSGGGAGEVADDGWSTSIPQVSLVQLQQFSHLSYHALCKVKWVISKLFKCILLKIGRSLAMISS